jgi:hypothetical protein
MVRLIVLPSVALFVAACIPEEGMTTINDRETPYSCAEFVELDLKGLNASDINPALLPERTRIIPPMTAVTMDHIPSRLNLETDANGFITRWYCG